MVGEGGELTVKRCSDCPAPWDCCASGDCPADPEWVQREVEELRARHVAIVARLTDERDEALAEVRRLTHALECAGERAARFYRRDAATRPARSAVAACSWIAEDVAGTLGRPLPGKVGGA